MDQGFNEQYGARELERVVERSLLQLIAPQVPAMIHATGGAPQRYEVVVQGGRLTLG